MIRDKNPKGSMIVIDLTGPDGNAYALMGYATKLSKQLGLDHTLVVQQMRSGDYDNLIKVFDRYFGDIVILER